MAISAGSFRRSRGTEYPAHGAPCAEFTLALAAVDGVLIAKVRDPHVQCLPAAPAPHIDYVVGGVHAAVSATRLPLLGPPVRLGE